MVKTYLCHGGAMHFKRVEATVALLSQRQLSLSRLANCVRLWMRHWTGISLEKDRKDHEQYQQGIISETGSLQHRENV